MNFRLIHNIFPSLRLNINNIKPKLVLSDFTINPSISRATHYTSLTMFTVTHCRQNFHCQFFEKIRSTALDHLQQLIFNNLTMIFIC